jgi:hypothetical protein
MEERELSDLGIGREAGGIPRPARLAGGGSTVKRSRCASLAYSMVCT